MFDMSKVSALKPYKDAGHQFDSAYGKCVHCKCPTIDLYEDAAYGEIRPCKKETSDE